MENTQLGRPAIKPKRKAQTILINSDLINKIQLLQLKRPGESISDIHNEALKALLKKNGI